MSMYDYWAGRDDAEASAKMGRIIDNMALAEERARKERVFEKCSNTMNGLASRVCSEIKWKTQYKASVSAWAHEADTLKKELLRIAGDTQEVRDFIARTEKEADEFYKQDYKDFLSKEEYYQQHAAEFGK